MNSETKLKLTSLTSYSLILLSGQMIGVPFLLWLILTCLDFGNPDQIFAVIGIIGIALNFTKYSKMKTLQIISFIFMLSPLVKRLTAIPIEKFNYLGFQIPLGIFVILYMVYVITSRKELKTAQKTK